MGDDILDENERLPHEQYLFLLISYLPQLEQALTEFEHVAYAISHTISVSRYITGHLAVSHDDTCT